MNLFDKHCLEIIIEPTNWNEVVRDLQCFFNCSNLRAISSFASNMSFYWSLNNMTSPLKPHAHFSVTIVHIFNETSTS